MKIRHTMTMAAALLAFAPISNAQELFENGGMEGGIVGSNRAPDGWSYPSPSPDISSVSSPGMGSWYGTPTVSPDGGTWVSLFSGLNGYSESIYQTVNGLTIGEQYEFSCYYAATPLIGSYYEYTAPNVTISGMTGYTNPGAATQSWDWRQYAYVLEATSTSATFNLSIFPNGNNSYASFDGLSLTHIPPVPEPSGALLLGLSGSLAVLRRRRAN